MSRISKRIKKDLETYLKIQTGYILYDDYEMQDAFGTRKSVMTKIITDAIKSPNIPTNDRQALHNHVQTELKKVTDGWKRAQQRSR